MRILPKEAPVSSGIASMPQILAANLPTFFQPSPRTKSLFDLGMTTIRSKRRKVWAALFQTLRAFAKQVLAASLPGVLAAVMGGSIDSLVALKYLFSLSLYRTKARL